MKYKNISLRLFVGGLFVYLCQKHEVMSSCVIKRNSKGKITRVLTPSGEVSTLFDKIAGIAAVSDLNKAAEAYMTIYNDKFRSKFGDWTRSVPRNKEAAQIHKRQT